MNGLAHALANWLGLVCLIWGCGLLVEANIIREAFTDRRSRGVILAVGVTAWTLIAIGAAGVLIRVALLSTVKIF